jgi:hypothetical protein
MEYAIELLEKNRRNLERTIKNSELMKHDIQKASIDLQKLSDLKKAIKLLSVQSRKSH